MKDLHGADRSHRHSSAIHVTDMLVHCAAVGLHTPKITGTKGKQAARPERLASTGSSASGAGGDMQRMRPAVRHQARSPGTGEVRRTKRCEITILVVRVLVSVLQVRLCCRFR